VETKNIIRGGERLGVYCVEKGASQRASKVIYDRANSAIAAARPEEFDWMSILKGAVSFLLPVSVKFHRFFEVQRVELDIP
jgi:2-dehydro-3-deoxygluconokinase